MHFVALQGLKSKKLLPSTPIRIQFWIKYQILDFFDPKPNFGLFAQPPFYSINRGNKQALEVLSTYVAADFHHSTR